LLYDFLALPLRLAPKVTLRDSPLTAAFAILF
jgi:hypothetical protein